MVQPARLNGRGRYLAARRLARGLSQGELADAVGALAEEVKEWEKGTGAPRPEQHADLAAALRLELDDLQALITVGPPQELVEGQLPIRDLYDHVLNPADRMAEVQRSCVPRMLQTRAYALALEHSAPGGHDEEAVLEEVELRLSRQVVLDRSPVMIAYAVLLAETVLIDPVGGPKVMAEQCDHIIEMAKLPNVEVRLLAADGRAACAPGSYEMFGDRHSAAARVVVAYDAAGREIHEGQHKLQRYMEMYNHLDLVAMSTEDSARRLTEIRDRYLTQLSPEQ